MSSRKLSLYAFIAVLALVVTACVPAAQSAGQNQPAVNTPAAEQPSEAPTEVATETPTEAPTAEPEPSAPATENPAAAAVVTWLADQLGVAAGDITVVGAEAVEWPDACLGLPAADEACTQVLTPGFLLTLQAGDQTYEVRTNQAGDNVRLVQPQAGSTDEGSAPAATGNVEGTRWLLASIGDQPIVDAPVRPYLELAAEGIFRGSAGCNSFVGGYELGDGTITFETPTIGFRACEAAGVMEQEQAFVSALAAATGYTLAGDTLTIETSDGALTFERVTGA